MNIPDEPHFAVVVEDKQYVYHPGDELSKSCPGHGYPEHVETINSIKYESYDSKERWEARIISLTNDRKKFKAIRAYPAKVKTIIEVEE